MDDSAFKSVLDGLEANRISLDRWLEFWTCLVVIGVAFELIFILWDHFEERDDWHKARTHAKVPMPSKPSELKLIFEMLSVALVVVGIVGELRVDAILGNLETNIRDTNEHRVLQLQREAGSARSAASDAVADAGKAKAKADAVGEQANLLTGQVSAATTGAANALGLAHAATRELSAFQKDLKDTRKLAADTHEALIQFVQFRQPRAKLVGVSLGSQGMVDIEGLKFSIAMKQFAGQKLDVRMDLTPIPDVADQDEVRDLAKSIEAIMHWNAQWNLTFTQRSNGDGVGIGVANDATAQTRKAAQALANELGSRLVTDEYGRTPVVFTLDSRPYFTAPPDTVVLYLGKHP